jgi:cellobiose-specific phosphotransferase system component IIB
MKEVLMSNREALLATIHKKHADRIPFVIRSWFLPHSQVEREARNQGLAINYMIPCMYSSMPHVNVTSQMLLGMWGATAKKTVSKIVFETPVVTVWTQQTLRDFAGAMEGNLNYEGIGSYMLGGLVKKPEDWDVLKFMAEDLEYEPCYEYIEYFKQLVGDEGIIFTFVGYHSPYTLLLIEWVGAVKLYIDHVKYPDKVDSVIKALAKSYEKQYSIAANAPADIIKYGDHIDEVLISPRIFERYILPEHNKFARMAHAKGKVTAIHCDGRLNKLKYLIGKLEHDIIHAITPPPMGNLPIAEALNLWKDKVLWINCEYHFMGVEGLKKHLLALLREIASASQGYRVIIDASTERWVPPDCLRMFCKIMSKATLPLTEEKVDKIEKSL